MLIKNPELKIKHLRELRNLTQEYMADQLNLSLRAYSKIESGETQLTINRVNEISSILDIDALDLLAFDEKKIFNAVTELNDSSRVKLSSDKADYYKGGIEFLKEQNKVLLEQIQKLLSIIEENKK